MNCHRHPLCKRPLIYGCLLIVFSLVSFHPALAQSSDHAAPAQSSGRKVKTRVEPEYPELAKKNNISGTTRVEVVVAPDGKVKNVRVLGGNPVLAQAAVVAVTKWKYEPATEESKIVVKFDFAP